MSAQEQRKALEASLDALRVNAETYEACTKELAKAYYYRFISLREAGFSESQSFEIVKQRGLD